jgi:hypothetical protein
MDHRAKDEDHELSSFGRGGDNPLDDTTSPYEIPPLPGSILLAEKMERRRFLRKSSTSLFLGFVAVSSGTASFLGFLAGPAQAAGACCPDCCGPSPCCQTTCCSKPCCTGMYHDQCVNNGSTCLGYSGTWSGQSCWGCNYFNQGTRICCDCKTNNQTGCPNPNGYNRCICQGIVPEAPQRLTIIRDARQVPASN